VDPSGTCWGSLLAARQCEMDRKLPFGSARCAKYQATTRTSRSGPLADGQLLG